MIKKLEHMKETLMCAVEMQLCNLEEIDTKELGEAIDMIKDLEEAIYYCTVTEAMKNPGAEWEWNKDNENNEHGNNRMYYDGRTVHSNGGDHARGHMAGMSEDLSYYSYPMMYRDEKEGKSYNSRRMYMEAKENKHDKAAQLRELEKYMQELSQDIVDMIADASPEEKQYLEKKISALAAKVGQMK